MGESSSEESVEDFEFLEQELNENKELDEMTRKLLNGIIQVPPKDKKRLDKMSREEMREKRRQKALEQGIELSDSYGSERDDPDLYGTIDHGKNASDVLEMPGSHRDKLKGSARVMPSELAA